jgi:hypothetical protein
VLQICFSVTAEVASSSLFVPSIIFFNHLSEFRVGLNCPKLSDEPAAFEPFFGRMILATGRCASRLAGERACAKSFQFADHQALPILILVFSSILITCVIFRTYAERSRIALNQKK